MDYICGLPLDTSNRSPVLWTQHLDAVLQMRSQLSRLEGQDQLLHLACLICFFWCSSGYGWLSGLWGHIAGPCPSSYSLQNHQVLFSRTVLYPIIPKIVLIVDAAITQVQDLVLGFAESREVLLNPQLKLVFCFFFFSVTRDFIWLKTLDFKIFRGESFKKSFLPPVNIYISICLRD